jgi:hypothetical protein
VRIITETSSWAQVFIIAMTVGSAFLTVGFANESKKVIDD